MRLNEKQLKNLRDYEEKDSMQTEIYFTDLLDTIDALKADLKLAESAVAGAYREAATHIPWDYGVCTCGVRWSPEGSCDPAKGWSQHILALTPPAAIRAEKLLVAQAELDSKRWFYEPLRLANSLLGDLAKLLPEEGEDCKEYDSLKYHLLGITVDAQQEAATAALEEIKKETPVPSCWRCGKPCIQGGDGSWMCDCTSTPFDMRREKPDDL